MFRACRLVVDTGIHQLNWTRDEAIQFMAQYVPMGIAEISVQKKKKVQMQF